MIPAHPIRVWPDGVPSDAWTEGTRELLRQYGDTYRAWPSIDQWSLAAVVLEENGTTTWSWASTIKTDPVPAHDDILAGIRWWAKTCLALEPIDGRSGVAPHELPDIGWIRLCVELGIEVQMPTRPLKDNLDRTIWATLGLKPPPRR